MIKRQLTGVEFVSCNTDAQSLLRSAAEHTIQLGRLTNQGLGAGADPNTGRQAAEESLDEVMMTIGDSHMVFITAGMGGGTGTGAAPVIAEACKKSGILTVAIVTTPFDFEGNRRIDIAHKGVEKLEKVVDTLIVVPNQKLFGLEDAKRISYQKSFDYVDDILYRGVQGVTDLIVRPGLINLDFADVKSIMEGTGRALMGTGEADGSDRSIIAAEKALYHPLLDDISIEGAKRVLINITGGPDCGLFEVKSISEMISTAVDPEANIIFGTALSDDMVGKIRVSLIVTGTQLRKKWYCW